MLWERPLGIFGVGISGWGGIQDVAPERMAGVMMKVTEEVKKEYWGVVHMDERTVAQSA